MSSTILRAPPRIKVLEALGAIADGRIEVVNENEALVRSSDGTRTYKVYVDVSRREVDSTDNGTVYRGYVGYPIVSFLMIKKLLPINENLMQSLRGIPWKKLNEEYKNYAKVMEVIIRDRRLNEIEVNKYIDQVLSVLRRMNLKRIQRYNEVAEE
ncbi:hypothetical protein [Vulcanisaeta souniana]|uniref:Uncharacterized protein n=1 Tax=Vulcanisaeta souniana JCM 11219 TaxID=1293586 RepID=A0A830DYF5_9CREN|nr:hypothetical protein [Vulcanisaeta souniana]BDR91979.1 hypothetical protein Vsou_10720 [Vulcanisaeta souniana JCM 11219]GGI68908.1 hypothetical protein GCM10007112_02330 [Vulcanisaeta souniana JCM 11219]